MEKERKIKSMSLVALIVAVLGLTVAFAALSQTLTINGSATMDRANWDIHYAADTTGGASAGSTRYTATGSATATNGTLTATSVSGLSATLTKPGDSVTFYWDVVNGGDIDAAISTLTPATISNSNLQCSASGTNNAQTDAANVCGDLVFTFKYVNGSAVAASDTLTVSEGTKHLELKISYPSTVTSEGDGATYPDDDVTITFPTITTVYTQTLSNQ